jgi:hypothetical protein
VRPITAESEAKQSKINFVSQDKITVSIADTWTAKQNFPTMI